MEAPQPERGDGKMNRNTFMAPIQGDATLHPWLRDLIEWRELHSSMSDNEFLVFIQVASYGKGGKCEDSNHFIGKRVGLSTESVKKRIYDMVKKGLLISEQNEEGRTLRLSSKTESIVFEGGSR